MRAGIFHILGEPIENITFKILFNLNIMKSTKTSVSNHNTLGSSYKPEKIIFTIKGSNLLVTSENKAVSKRGLTRFQSLSLENSKSKQEGEDEIYIEIIRDSVEQPEEYSINNISSSYGAFWKEDYEMCINRRTCVECGHILFTPQQLLHHLENSHHIKNPNECFVCHKLFRNGIERGNHLLEIHHLEKPDFTCEACFKVFESETDKITHRTHHIKRFKCKWCYEPFPCEYLLNYHIRNCSLRRTDLDCHICGCQFRSSHILQLHSLRHNRISCELCNFCPLNATDAKGEDAAVSLVKHLKNSHTPEEVDKILVKLKVQDEEEENLDKLFMTQIEENLNKLGESTPLIRTEKHDQCWQISLNDQQETVSKSPVPEASLQCTECHKTFMNKEDMIQHELSHQTPFSCSVCSLKFSHRRGFKKHMRLHGILVKPTSVKYTCRHCSVNCPTLSALHTHLLIHTDQKPYLCDKCGLKFRRPNALKAHDLAVHNSRVLHRCPQCDVSSLSKSSLLRHIQCVHGGVRRFICGLCGNRCLQNQGLRRHLKSEHNLEYPPMESLCKKSSMEIHIIPSPENLSPNNPIVDVLKLAIREEEFKLKALRKLQNVEESDFENHKSSLCAESIIDRDGDGQSLNILGDVASKATPLEEAKTAPEFLQSESQEVTRFLCAGCQYSSNSLSDLSLHLSQCQQGCTASFVELESDEATEVKAPVTYSLASSLARPVNEVSNGMPYQLCFLPPDQTILGTVPVCNNSLEHGVLPPIDTGTAMSSPQTSENLLSSSISSASLDELTSKVNENNSVSFTSNLAHVVELNDSRDDSSRLPADIIPMTALESSSSTQLEFLESSNFIFQEDYLIREETCKAYELNETSAPFTTLKSISLNGTESESLKQRSETSAPDTCQKHSLSGAVGIKTNQVASDLPKVESVLLPNHPKGLDNTSSCSPVSTTSNLVTPSHVECSTVASCDSVVHVELNNESPNNFNNIKFTQIFAKSKTGSSKHINGQNKSSVSETANHSSGTLEKGVHVCGECGKLLSSASTFKRHLEVHFGGKPHQCSYCDKCFRYKHNLTVHLRSHTGAKPFECTICNRKFRYLSELSEHKMSHNASKSFSCSECGLLFARKRDLRRHSLSHSKREKPKCHVCQKTFSRSDYLTRHIKSHKPSAIMDNEESSSCETSRCQVIKKSGTKTKVQMEKSRSREDSQHDSKKSSRASSQSHRNISASTVKNCASDDLISLAYQAAEDGVEFMFVEEVTTCTYDEQAVEVSVSEVDSNVLYV